MAFLGFVGIFLVLSSRDERFSGDEALMIKILVILSVTPVFTAPLPLLMDALGVPALEAWRLSSVVLAIIGIVSTVYMTFDTVKAHRNGTNFVFHTRDLAFLVFGPMVDIKSTAMFLAIFKVRAVIYMITIPLLMTMLFSIWFNLNVAG